MPTSTTAPLKLRYAVLDVFTTTRFAGNQLAVVHLESDAALALTQAQKQTIGTEFNLSETIFVHPTNSSNETTVDIFTTTRELPFAGHPTVGVAWYLGTSTTLLTRAGRIPTTIVTPSGAARLQIPVDYKAHKPGHALAATVARDLQPALNHPQDLVIPADALPVVSIVKGMNFLVLELTSEDALARVGPFTPRIRFPPEYLGAWDGFASLYAFWIVDEANGEVRSRMFDGTKEDPATGSAASALGSYLTLRKGVKTATWNITQGVEMGRRSQIQVSVVTDGDKVESVSLQGHAIKVMEGTLEM